MDVKKCEICGKEFAIKTGWFSKHLKEEHNLELKDYIIEYEMDEKPLCECGCGEVPNLYRGKFKKYVTGHNTFEWKKKRWIEDNGEPICPVCGEVIEKWNRGKPNKYCSDKCMYSVQDNFNQEKIRNNVKKRYGVDNVMDLKWVREKQKKNIKEKYNNDFVDIQNKFKQTNLERYGVEYPQQLKVFQDKQKETMLNNYGIKHISESEKFRKDSRDRMIKNNPMFDPEVADRVSKTYIENVLSGKTKLFKNEKYKDTGLYYQSSYELEFLELCDKIGIISEIENGNSYNYLKEDKDFGFRTLTDFSYKDIEIEIKSTWILEKQGGWDKIYAKKRSVEDKGKTYSLILDKNYEEFLKWIK